MSEAQEQCTQCGDIEDCSRFGCLVKGRSAQMLTSLRAREADAERELIADPNSRRISHYCEAVSARVRYETIHDLHADSEALG